ncbi:MAG: hypothetical protein DYH17_15015 [Xanthomonadales bacterium PRO6]|nr:hypothetical protein [Xanthomonadales bacterium PRO6]
MYLQAPTERPEHDASARAASGCGSDHLAFPGEFPSAATATACAGEPRHRKLAFAYIKLL